MSHAPNFKHRKVLVVEDHVGLAELLEEELQDAGIQARQVENAEKAAALLSRWKPDLVVSDLRLPGMDGFGLLEQVKTLDDPPLFLIITAFGSVEQAVSALKAGADDFLTKPLDLEHFIHVVKRLLTLRELRQQVEGFKEVMGKEDFHGMIGHSDGMRELYSQIRRVAPASGPVLVLGESGTGKELVARAVHALSDRAEAPFLAVNCAGIPEPLMESEFFGHEEGSFTGSKGARDGLFLEASGGSLFLDEIAEMPMALQSKLLRILQDGKVRRVGANREEDVDVRIVAATHQELEDAVKEGRFREDLFYRLETFHLRVPPLRERGEDVELLAHRFLKLMNTRTGKRVRGFTPTALIKLTGYSYPGNVRELQNAMERAVTFCDRDKIRPEDLPRRMRDDTAGAAPDRVALPSEWMSPGEIPPLAEMEKRYIRQVLEATGGNKKKASELLGITRKTLYSRLDL
ncbi:MAG: sigma-54 dependent transcriptional regulator [Kiritimatiellia bacterium]